MEARPGAVLFHPFISSSGERGPFIDPHARAGLLGIDQNVRLPEIARAVYDGLGACRVRLLHRYGWFPGDRADPRWSGRLEIDARDPGCLLELPRTRRDPR